MYNVYSLFDRKLKVYGALVQERNDFAIQRTLADGVRENAESLLGKHPEDFDLFQVGVFNEESGLLMTDAPFIPRLVCNVLELVVVFPSLSSKEG